MTVPAVLAPVFALVLLAFVLLFWMGRVRVAAVRAGEVATDRGSPRRFPWTGRAQKVSDCFHNQLELPIFFYVLVALALLTRKADLAFVVMSWAFVATRYAHAYVHTGPNVLRWRFRLFGVGALLLSAMWLIFAIRVLTGA